MGLSFHFSGRLRKADDLPALIAEVKDVSNISGWKYHIFETRFPNDCFEDHTSYDDVYGICFSPEKCEPVFFTFLSNGAMVSPDRIEIFAYSEDETERSYIYSISVKTQFSGYFNHQLLIRLIKHLNEKYFEDFRLDDESYYWETDDENLMRERFKLYDRLMDNVELSIQTFPIEKEEDSVSYFERLMTHVEKLKNI